MFARLCAHSLLLDYTRHIKIVSTWGCARCDESLLPALQWVFAFSWSITRSSVVFSSLFEYLLWSDVTSLVLLVSLSTCLSFLLDLQLKIDFLLFSPYKKFSDVLSTRCLTHKRDSRWWSVSRLVESRTIYAYWHLGYLDERSILLPIADSRSAWSELDATHCRWRDRN